MTHRTTSRVYIPKRGGVRRSDGRSGPRGTPGERAGLEYTGYPPETGAKCGIGRPGAAALAGFFGANERRAVRYRAFLGGEPVRFEESADIRDRMSL